METSLISTMNMYPTSSTVSQSAKGTTATPEAAQNVASVTQANQVAQTQNTSSTSQTNTASTGATASVESNVAVAQEKVSISATGTAKVYSENGLAATTQVQDPSATAALRQTLSSDTNYQTILQQISSIDSVLKMMEGNEGVGNSLSSLMGSASNVPGLSQTESLAYSVYSSGTSQVDVQRWLNSEVIRDPQLASSLMDKKAQYSFQQTWLIQLKTAIKDTGELADKLVHLDNDTSKEEATTQVEAFIKRYNEFRKKAAADMENAGPQKSDTLKTSQGYFAMQRDTEKWFYSRGAFNSLEDIGITSDEKTGVLTFDKEKFSQTFDSSKADTLALLNEFGEEYMGTVDVYGSDEGPLQARIDNIQQGLDWLKTYAPALQNLDNARNTQNVTTRAQLSLYASVSYMQQ